jgi:hypothetical protein
MPKSPVVRGAGNTNMKGKKYKLMSCRCCVCIDFRDRELEKEHKKEISEAQYIKDMKSVGVPNEDIDWHLDLYRKTIEIMKNKNELRRPTLQE